MKNNDENKNLLHVFHGSITNYDSTFLIDNMAIIVDFDIGAILKFGDIDNTNIKKDYEDKYAKMNDLGFQIKLITFDRYEGVLTIDEICTIVNYGLNAHSYSFLELFKMNEADLKNRLKELNRYGY